MKYIEWQTANRFPTNEKSGAKRIPIKIIAMPESDLRGVIISILKKE
jgi:hypothetical protein